MKPSEGKFFQTLQVIARDVDDGKNMKDAIKEHYGRFADWNRMAKKHGWALEQLGYKDWFKLALNEKDFQKACELVDSQHRSVVGMASYNKKKDEENKDNAKVEIESKKKESKKSEKKASQEIKKSLKLKQVHEIQREMNTEGEFEELVEQVEEKEEVKEQVEKKNEGGFNWWLLLILGIAIILPVIFSMVSRKDRKENVQSAVNTSQPRDRYEMLGLPPEF